MSLLLLFNSPPYHRALVDTAKRLLADNEPAIALVTAHMACEIYVEQVMSAAFQKANLGVLEDAVDELLPSRNLANKRVRDVYAAVTGDRQIQETPFWSKFKQSTELRNKAVHQGLRVSRDDADRACEVVAQVLEHLEKVMQTLKTQP